MLITVVRKPISGTVASCALDHGGGGLNIDATRVGTTPRMTHSRGNVCGGSSQIYGNGNGLPAFEYPGSSSRWPANVIHDGSEGVMGLFPETVSGKMNPTRTTAGRSIYGQDAEAGFVTMETYADSGSAARFFYVVTGVQ